MYSLDFARYFPHSSLQGLTKQDPEDFVVVEQLGFEPSGEGEHLFLEVEKQGLTTEYVQSRLAKAFALPGRDVSYAGMKDKQAITRQWFSVRTPVTELPDIDMPAGQYRIVQTARNWRKLRRGSHQGNHFRIVVRNLVGETALLQERVDKISSTGLPNYFGEQRFGWQGKNIDSAIQLFSRQKDHASSNTGKHRSANQRYKQGIYLSAIRAWLFNSYLSQRLTNNTWNSCLDGDVMALEGARSTFKAQTCDAEIARRLQQLDIHPTGPLWGVGDPAVTAAAAELEKKLGEDFPQLCMILERAGLQQDRRALRMKVEELQVENLPGNRVAISFYLGRGCYATSVVRELLAEQQEIN